MDVKGTRVSASSLLDGDEVAPQFDGGTAVTLALGFHNYHRFHSPLTANVDAQTTSGYAQYVPNGLPDLPVTPGCEVWTEGHFCPQTARVA